MFAHIFIEGADRTNKYGSLIKTLRSEYGRGNENAYPLTLEAAVKTLNTHSWDAQYFEQKKKQRQAAKEKKEESNQSNEEQKTSFAQRKSPICFKCGLPNHKSIECTRDIPKGEWWIHKQTDQQHAQLEGNNTEHGGNSNNTVGSDNSQSSTQQNGGGGNFSQAQQQQQVQTPQQSQLMQQRVVYRQRQPVTSFNGPGKAKFQGLQFMQHPTLPEQPQE